MSSQAIPCTTGVPAMKGSFRKAKEGEEKEGIQNGWAGATAWRLKYGRKMTYNPSPAIRDQCNRKGEKHGNLKYQVYKGDL